MTRGEFLCFELGLDIVIDALLCGFCCWYFGVMYRFQWRLRYLIVG